MAVHVAAPGSPAIATAGKDGNASDAGLGKLDIGAPHILLTVDAQMVTRIFARVFTHVIFRPRRRQGDDGSGE